MLYSINDIRKKIHSLGKKISIPNGRLNVFDTSPGDGRPHVSFDNNQYNYVYAERGVEFSRKTSDKLNELLYWIMSDIIYSIAFQYELENRIEHRDGRRIIFQKVIQLMGELDPLWALKAQEEIDSILSKSPYNDQDE